MNSPRTDDSVLNLRSSPNVRMQLAHRRREDPLGDRGAAEAAAARLWRRRDHAAVRDVSLRERGAAGQGGLCAVVHLLPVRAGLSQRADLRGAMLDFLRAWGVRAILAARG